MIQISGPVCKNMEEFGIQILGIDGEMQENDK